MGRWPYKKIRVKSRGLFFLENNTFSVPSVVTEKRVKKGTAEKQGEIMLSVRADKSRHGGP